MRVGVIQMQCDDDGADCKEKNMATLRRLVEEAMNVDDNKPDLLLGPECAVCGYSYDKDTVWSSAEPQGGPTEQFVCEIAASYKIFFGISYLEARKICKQTTTTSWWFVSSPIPDADPLPSSEEEAHIVNTFVLAGPDGTIQGRVCKARPAPFESYLFTSPNIVNASQKPCHVIEINTYQNTTTPSKIGVLICYENYLTQAIQELQNERVDILLQPFSGPLADDTRKDHHLKEMLRQLYLEACSANSVLLNCPALYCNKVGQWKQPSPSTYFPLKFDTEFPGCSAICNASGDELGRMDATEQGVLIRDIIVEERLEGGDKSTTQATTNPKPLLPPVPRYWGGFSNSSPFLKVLLFFEFWGSRYYKNSQRRKELALAALEGVEKTD